MLLGTLGANSLGNMLPNKSLKAARFLMPHYPVTKI